MLFDGRIFQGSLHPDWEFPAISTTADILKRAGLITGWKRRIKSDHPGCPGDFFRDKGHREVYNFLFREG